MSLRLTLSPFLMRGQEQMRWLKMVDRAITEALVKLIGDERRTSMIVVQDMPDSLGSYRSSMSKKHDRLVYELFRVKGDKGLEQAKEAMHMAGLLLGIEFKESLKLTDVPSETTTALRLFYRIIGIEYVIDDDESTMKVWRCALSKNYSTITCEVISRLMEGIAHGLDPNLSLGFTKMNGPETPMCLAEIVWKD